MIIRNKSTTLELIHSKKAELVVGALLVENYLFFFIHIIYIKIILRLGENFTKPVKTYESIKKQTLLYLHKFHSKKFFVLHFHEKTTEDKFMKNLPCPCEEPIQRTSLYFTKMQLFVEKNRLVNYNLKSLKTLK